MSQMRALGADAPRAATRGLDAFRLWDWTRRRERASPSLSLTRHAHGDCPESIIARSTLPCTEPIAREGA